ncbi:MAG: hypothetical protein DRP87_06135 [Spirochaetes bacterium]|nr:MAG: hypothetical protein DRP87_06135 [Spirochaetota bacterium]
MLNKSTVIFLFIFILSSSGFTEENQESIKSLREERTAILKYGIDSEIIELVDKMIEERDDSLAEEAEKVFKQTTNPRVRIKLLNFFSQIEYRNAEEMVLKLIEDHENRDRDLIVESIRYISESKNNEILTKAAEILEELTTHRENEIASAAIKGLGKTGKKEYAEKLISLFEKRDYPSSLKPEIILALGDLKAEKALEPLIKILENKDESEVLRRYACDSLGKIGNPKAVEPLIRAFRTGDTILRSYAIYALGKFPGEETESILIDALRDSYYKVRISAAKALGERKVKSAVDILIYKAERDPEPSVREEAIKALADIGEEKGLVVLRNLFKNYRTPTTLRMIALKALTESDLEKSIPVIEEVIKKEWNKEESKLLMDICKILSITESPLLKGLFAKLLEHPDSMVKIYGILGIQKNNLKELREHISKLRDEKYGRTVNKYAENAYDVLK